MDRLQGRHPIGFGHHAAGADFAGGDHFNVDAGFGQAAEHAGGRAGGRRHARPHRAHPGDCHALLEAGFGPLGQQGLQGRLGPAQVVAAQGEAHVAAELVAAAVGALRLDDRIEAEARIGQGPADGGGAAGPVGNAMHRHLGLVPVEGDAAHLRFAQARRAGVEPQLLLGQFEGLGGRL